MQTGKVKWFNETKGFGFIVPDEGGDDAFVHITAVKESGIDRLEDNQRVEFDLAETFVLGSCSFSTGIFFSRLTVALTLRSST